MKIATAIINRGALRHNAQRLRELAQGRRVIAAVKADAYGHGIIEVAKTLENVDCFGVARLEEALILREQGITKPILLLEGFFEADELPLLAEHKLETVVHSEYQLAALENAQLSSPITAWMKLDTGMHRLGVLPHRAEPFYQRLTVCRNVVNPVNIVSHFCRADELDAPTTLEQLACFDRFAEGKPGIKSMAASNGILFWPQTHKDCIRAGIIMYGVSPATHCQAREYDFRPVMTLKTSLIAVREHPMGGTVGYGGIWQSPRDTLLGVLGMGYGDGYPRGIQPGTPVWINGREVPIVGRVSMDMISVDLGPGACDRVGDEVILWGEPLPVERVAKLSGISAYELITKIMPRTKHEYIDE